jgi:DNA invertase Pin-like site-specific DNA recombinase
MVIDEKASRTGRLIGYARVSTTDQRLDVQLTALRNAGCVQIFHDHGVSGAKEARPGLDEAMRVLKAKDTLCVYKLDRLGRSVTHLSDLLVRLNESRIQFRSLTEGIDTATAGGKLVYHVFSAVAEFSRDLIRENTCAGLRAAKARGSAIGRPRRLTDDEILQALSLMCEHGLSHADVADEFDVSSSTLYRGLKRIGLKEAA